jgi:hypothetical protein
LYLVAGGERVELLVNQRIMRCDANGMTLPKTTWSGRTNARTAASEVRLAASAVSR